MEGFQTETLENIRVGINASATANFYMYAELLETVTVTSEAPLVDMTSSAAGNSFTAEFIKDLPTNRNFYDMISVSPGVATSAEGKRSADRLWIQYAVERLAHRRSRGERVRRPVLPGSTPTPT